MSKQEKPLDESVQNVVDHGSEAPSDSQATNAGVDSMRKKIQSATTVLSPTVDAHVETRDYGGSGSAAGEQAARVGLRLAGLTTGSFGGNEGAILGNLSGTGKFDKSRRSDSRQGQKLDEPVRKIDQLAAEQIVQAVTIPSPLEENPDDGMGYMGQPLNQNTRNQKTSGLGPMDSMYQRSIDEVTRDALVYTFGQHTVGSDGDTPILPRTTYDSAFGSLPFLPTVDGTHDYVGKKMTAVLPNGNLQAIIFEDESTPSRAHSHEDENAGNSTVRREINRIELDVQAMINEAGNNMKENFSPLGSQVDAPDSTNAYLRVLEEIQGSHYYLADRFFGKALAYQLNKASKDGQRPIATRNEILAGYACYTPEGATFERDLIVDPDNNANEISPFSTKMYRHGAPSVLIAIGDTVAKYRTRGDLLNQPRGFKLAYQALHNRAGALKIRPILPKVTSAIDTFSTIDSEYDPLKPVYNTDGFALSQEISNSALGDYYKATRVLQHWDFDGSGQSPAWQNVFDLVSAKGYVLTGRLAFTISDSSALLQHNRPGDKTYVKRVIVVPVFKDATTKDFADAPACRAGITAFISEHAGSEAADQIVYIASYVSGGNRGFVCSVAYPNFANTASGKALLEVDDSSTLANTAVLSVKNDDDPYENTGVACEVYPQEYVYHYSNRGTEYTSVVHSSLHFGLIDWFKRRDGDIYEASGTTANSRVEAITVPMSYTTRALSTYAGILGFALTDVLRDRATTMYDVLRYENGNGHYPYSDFISLSDVDVNASPNYQFVDSNTMLKVGRMINEVAFTWRHPEIFWLCAGSFSGDIAFMLPDYISDATFTRNANHRLVRDSHGVHAMNYPCFREGKQLQSAQDYYTGSMRVNRLCGDRLVTPDQLEEDTDAATVYGVYKYGTISSGVPTIESLRLDDDSADRLLSAVRELGLFQVLPAGIATPAFNVTKKANGASAGMDWFDPDDGWHINAFANGSYRAICYRNAEFMRNTATNPASRQPGANGQSNVVRTQASNFQQIYQVLQAGVYLDSDASLVANAAPTAYEGTAGTDKLYYRFAPVLGQFLRLSDMAKNALQTSRTISMRDKAASSSPFTNSANMPNVYFLASLYYNRLNKLEAFFVSPFDTCPRITVSSGAYELAPSVFDPYDLQFIFNFCGFMPAEYDEDVNDRLRKIIESDWLYVDEEWFKALSYLA